MKYFEVAYGTDKPLKLLYQSASNITEADLRIYLLLNQLTLLPHKPFVGFESAKDIFTVRSVNITDAKAAEIVPRISYTRVKLKYSLWIGNQIIRPLTETFYTQYSLDTLLTMDIDWSNPNNIPKHTFLNEFLNKDSKILRIDPSLFSTEGMEITSRPPILQPIYCFRDKISHFTISTEYEHISSRVSSYVLL